MSFKEIYEYQQLPAQADYACTGMFMGYVRKQAAILKEIYYKYDHSVSTLTDGGDEPILNYEFQQRFQINWIPYHYQAIWIYEMANSYPFLYQQDRNSDLINLCVENSINSNTFLHFAGSWHESDMFDRIEQINLSSELQEEFNNYRRTKVFGRPVGIVKPKK
jgi:hypothetical protein